MAAVTQKDILEELKRISETLQNFKPDNKANVGVGAAGTNIGEILKNKINGNGDNTGEETENILKKLDKTLDKLAEKLEKDKPEEKPSGETLNTKITGEITKVITGVTGIAYNILEAQIKKQQVRLNTAAELQRREIQVFGNTLKKATEIMADNVTGKIFDTAYKSLDAVMNGGREFYIKSIQDQLTMSKMNIDIQKIQKETTAKTIGQAAQLIGGIASSFNTAAGSIISAGLSLTADLTQKEYQYQISQLELLKQQKELEVEVTKETIEMINSTGEAYRNMSKNVTQIFYNLAGKSFEYGRSLGLNGEQLKGYTDSVVRLNKNLAQVGLTFEDYYKMQETYNDRNGRSGIISDNEALMMGGLALRTGVDISDIASITGVMQQFNISIDNGSQMMYEISNTASKMGLSAKKFTKDVEQNLKLAEKYQFKGGVRGMMDMVLQAQKLRFNINELSGSMEKMLSGNIEDVMQTSARLNVLGGNAAIFSDPFSMMYNAAANPKAYMENLNRMIGGYGTFNKKTGETDFSINEVYRMRAIADATGQSAENVMNQARQKNKEAALRRQFGGYVGFDKYSDMIAQNAVYNRESGKWEIKVADRSKEGGFRTATVEEALSNEKLFDNIFPEDKQDTLIEYVRQILDVLDPAKAMEAEEKRGTGHVLAAKGVTGSLYKMTDGLIKEHKRFIDANTQNFVNAIDETSKATLEAQKTMNIIAEKKEVYEAYIKSLEENQKEMDKFKNAISDATTTTGRAFGVYNKGGNEAVGGEVGKDMQTPLLQNYLADKTLTKEEVWEMQRKGILDAFVAKNGLTGMLDDDQIASMVKGSIRYINGEFYDLEGRLLRKERNAEGAEESRKKFRKTGYENKEYGAIRMLKDIPRHIGWEWFDNRGDVYDRSDKNLQKRGVGDVIISPKHGVFQTAPQDTIVAWRPGGDIDRSESKKNSFGGNISGNATLTINGTLKLDSGRTSIDLMEILRNDPKALRELAKEVIVEGSRTVFGGKPLYAPNRYTFT